MNQADGFFKNLFTNDEGEIRSGWRALAFYAIWLVVSLMLGLIPAIIFGLPQPDPNAPANGRTIIFLATIWTVQLVAALIASAICARALERRSFASVGFKLHNGWLRDFAYGSVIGGATLAAAVAIATAAGATRYGVQNTNASALFFNFLVLFITFLIAGASEELVVRGFPFQAFLHNLGPSAAVTITSVLFGLLHYQNPDVTLFSTINTILAGVWLGVAYLMTRSLWLATALHYSWNLVMVFVFGLPVSGIKMYSHLAWLDSQPAFPVWLSGGSYGPEAGAAATLALVLSTLFIWKAGLFSASKEMAEATRHGSIERVEDDPQII
jgi:membrane protease YdiL (CAAX protease family)